MCSVEFLVYSLRTCAATGSVATTQANVVETTFEKKVFVVDVGIVDVLSVAVSGWTVCGSCRRLCLCCCCHRCLNSIVCRVCCSQLNVCGMHFDARRRAMGIHVTRDKLAKARELARIGAKRLNEQQAERATQPEQQIQSWKRNPSSSSWSQRSHWSADFEKDSSANSDHGSMKTAESETSSTRRYNSSIKQPIELIFKT